jgi:hypothetical protein
LPIFTQNITFPHAKIIRGAPMNHHAMANFGGAVKIMVCLTTSALTNAMMSYNKCVNPGKLSLSVFLVAYLITEALYVRMSQCPNVPMS